MQPDNVERLASWLSDRVLISGTTPDITRYVQRCAQAEGYDVGQVDGLWGPRTDTAWRQMANLLPTPVPPAYEASAHGQGTQWPGTSEAELNEFYGMPRENNPHIVQFSLPYPMRLAWSPGTVVRRASANRACVEAFEEALTRIRDFYGSPENLRAHRMDLFGGIYNLRKKRGGTEWSLHAYGAAIDLDPDHNKMGWPWPGRATMPKEVVEIFEGLGANAGARWNHPDAMHFQWTR